MSRRGARRVALALGVAAVAGAIAAGLMILGSPADERLRRLDEMRVSDLLAISRAFDSHWTTHGRLPGSLTELLAGPRANARSRDPATGQEYGYRALGERTYELCADFDRDSSEGLPGMVNRFWAHGAGRQCFHLEVEIPAG